MSSLYTIRPVDDRGNCEVLDERLAVVATAQALPSRTIPGYITVRVTWPRNEPASWKPAALRVPIDWLTTLGGT